MRLVRLLVLPEPRGRQVDRRLDRQRGQQVAGEADPDHAARGLEPPDLGQHVADDVRDREDNVARVENPAVDLRQLDGQDVGHDQAGDEQAGHRHVAGGDHHETASSTAAMPRSRSSSEMVSGGLSSSTSASIPAGTAITPRSSSRSHARTASHGRPSARPRPRTPAARRAPASPSRAARSGSALVLDHVEHGQRGGAGERAAQVRVGVDRDLAVAGPGAVHQLGRPQHGGQRQAAAQRLAAHQQVGPHALGLAHPHRAGAAEAGEHLVDHQQRAPAVALVAQRLQPAVGRRDDAARGPASARPPRRRRSRRRRAPAPLDQVDGRQPGLERLAEQRPAADAERAQRRAVVAAAERDQLAAAGRQQRRLQRQLDGAGAGQRPQRAGQAERRDRGQPLGQPDPHRGRVEVAEPVKQLRRPGRARPRPRAGWHGRPRRRRTPTTGRGSGGRRRPRRGCPPPAATPAAACRDRPAAPRGAASARPGRRSSPAEPAGRATSCATYPAMLGFSFRRRIE